MPFLESLNMDLLDSIILKFVNALKVKRSSSASTLQVASSVCSSVMRTVQKDPYSLETAMAVDGLWRKVDIVNDAHNSSKMLEYATRALVMVTTWAMFDWVTRIVNDAISNPETPSWVTGLITDIRKAIQDHHADNTASKRSTNHAAAKPSRAKAPKASLKQKYLLNIPRMSDYEFTIPRLIFSVEKMMPVIRRIAIDAIQFWLHFPSSEENTVKSSLIASLMETKTLAILYLEPVWKMFQNPYVTVINGPGSNQRRSKPHTKKTLEAFHHQFCDHDLNDPDSELGKRLGHLEKLIGVWSEKDDQGQKQPSILPSDSSVSSFLLLFCNSSELSAIRILYPLLLRKKGRENIYNF